MSSYEFCGFILGQMSIKIALFLVPEYVVIIFPQTFPITFDFPTSDLSVEMVIQGIKHKVLICIN